MSVWFLYLIHTQNNRLYTGITTDVERRFSQHQRGKGAKALRGAGKLSLVFSYPIGDKSLALRAEYRVKQFTRAEKEHLLTDNTKLVNLLASLHTPGD